MSSTRISELNDSDAGNLSKLGKRRQRLRVLDDDDDDDDDKSDKENEYNAREMSTSLSNLPSSIPVVAPNSLYSINKYSRQDGLRRNAVHRAHSPSDNRARPTEDDGDDVQEPLPGADDDAVDIGVLERLRKMSKGAAKRVVKNPRPKLDPQ
ncbi:unnamed protein product [Trichobilharzia regenti]|nr:unnamed protein product [Trichobilharzia regenti]